jgi:hypothetical protein
MSTTHSDQTPQAAPVEWRAAPQVSTEQTALPPAPAEAPKRNRGRIAAGVAALLIAVGGTTGYLVSHATSSSATSATSSQQGGPGGAAGGGNLGFQPTNYHLDGTITAIGNGNVTIKTSAGATTTYSVTSSTHLMANGSTATLSSFKVGDSVVGSTTTQGGTTLNDLVSGMGAGTRGGTPPQGAAGAGTGSTNS